MNHASRNVPRPVVAAVLAALTLILAGCGVRYDFVIHDDETADLTYIMWDSSDLRLITKENCTEQELGKSTPFPEGVEATYSFTSHNDNPACQVTAKAVPLSKLQTDTWTIKHKDGQYVFDLSPGSLSKLSSKNPQLSSQNIGGNTKVSVSVTFPGEVTKSNGRNDGNKVTWDDALESSDGLHAEGEDGMFHLRWWMVAVAAGAVLLIVAGVLLYLLRVRRAQRMNPASPYGEVPRDAGAPGAIPSDVYISGPYQSPLPGTQPPTSGPTQPYPVADLQAGYSPYVEPGPGAGTFPPQDAGYQNGGYSAGPGIYGPYAPGPDYTQMPYQEGHGHADFRPQQARTGGQGMQPYPPYQGG
ncbi:hypothetical protein E4J66_13495 [Actinomyces viscosus]|uniref:LppM domain-containing protein n=1 Tax=Actinomyces viscosus TaxID=1656 RepID=A0A3S4VB33_ACTVI|nr:hypothetical protein [Actinomyces viscosus]TFH51009.1 hypothetical protein E4J66_13495 [Actinomyces viscosus]VEI16739.1 Uncharacterised protein [Actinomyces viscosus]